MNLILIKPLLNRGPHYDAGLAYIASALEKKHRVRLLDLAFHSKHYDRFVLSNLKDFKPGAVIFSVNSYHFHNTLKIASLIRTHYPDLLLVYTGVHPTLKPEETIHNGFVDAICIGEGEDTLVEYMQKVEAAQEPEGIAGLWYKNRHGAIVRNPLRPFREDIDTLPFPNWDYSEMDKYFKLCEPFKGAIKISSSRGCPYECSYCVSPAIKKAVPGTFYRLRSPENIIEEIKINVHKYYGRGFRHLQFGDDTFGVDLKHMEKFCRLFVKEGLSRYLTWSCQTRADIVTEYWAGLARGSGCVMVSLGIESGDAHVRTMVYNKKITNEDIENACQALQGKDILYRMNFLICGPKDSKTSVRDSLKFVEKLKPALAVFHFYRALPGTELDTCASKTEQLPDTTEHANRHVSAAPLKHTDYLNPFDVTLIFWKIQAKRALSLITSGVSLRGFSFIADLLREFAVVLKIRPMLDGYVAAHLECSTVIRYLCERNKNNVSRED